MENRFEDKIAQDGMIRLLFWNVHGQRPAESIVRLVDILLSLSGG